MKNKFFEDYPLKLNDNNYNKIYAWRTAIGLQQVDRMDPSDYLINIAINHIKGNISFNDAHVLIDAYYKQNRTLSGRLEEADKVSIRIAELLLNKSFKFSPGEFLKIHQHLFNGLYIHAGRLRQYNISKKEWVLEGDTVIYGDFFDLRETLEYDFNIEKNFDYKNLSKEEIIKHIAIFIANVWQNHVFGEGNTRTTAVFLLKYLSSLGINVVGDPFTEKSWYFRNALVRANYTNEKTGVCSTNYFLELFLRNLILGENNVLSNKDMHISNELNVNTN